MQNDPSDGFHGIILSMLKELGYNDAAEGCFFFSGE
jgi:hypothetical protein